MWTNTKHIPTQTRRQILHRDHNTCQHCGTQAPNKYLEIDHKTPISQGGTNTEENLQTLCRACHQRKTRAETRKAQQHRKNTTKKQPEQHPGLKP